MKNLIKKNILSIKPSSTLIINEKAKQLSKQGKKIYNFGFGQSRFGNFRKNCKYTSII